MWVLKKLNLDWGATLSQRVNDMNDLNGFLIKAYESSALYVQMIKKYHDQKNEKCEFTVSDIALLFNSMLRLFPRKVKSKWIEPFSRLGSTH